MKYNAEVIFLKEELEAVEDDLTSLDKHLNDIERLKYEARQCISQWKTEQEEKVTGHHLSNLKIQNSMFYRAAIHI